MPLLAHLLSLGILGYTGFECIDDITFTCAVAAVLSMSRVYRNIDKTLHAFPTLHKDFTEIYATVLCTTDWCFQTN